MEMLHPHSRVSRFPLFHRSQRREFGEYAIVSGFIAHVNLRVLDPGHSGVSE